MPWLLGLKKVGNLQRFWCQKGTKIFQINENRIFERNLRHFFGTSRRCRGISGNFGGNLGGISGNLGEFRGQSSGNFGESRGISGESRGNLGEISGKSRGNLGETQGIYRQRYAGEDDADRARSTCRHASRPDATHWHRQGHLLHDMQRQQGQNQRQKRRHDDDRQECGYAWQSRRQQHIPHPTSSASSSSAVPGATSGRQQQQQQQHPPATECCPDRRSDITGEGTGHGDGATAAAQLLLARPLLRRGAMALRTLRRQHDLS